MVTCPRCGNNAVYLADDAFVLIRCEFCGDDIDATDLVVGDELDRTIERLLIAPVRPAAALTPGSVEGGRHAHR